MYSLHSIPFHSISIPFYLCKIFTAFSKTLSVTHCSTVQVCIKFHDFAHKRVFSGSNTPGPPTQEGVTVQCICLRQSPPLSFLRLRVSFENNINCLIEVCVLCMERSVVISKRGRDWTYPADVAHGLCKPVSPACWYCERPAVYCWRHC